MSGPVILVDNREQRPLRFSLPTERGALATGDYSIQGLENFAVEVCGRAGKAVQGRGSSGSKQHRGGWGTNKNPYCKGSVEMSGPVYAIGRECYACMGSIRRIEDREYCPSTSCNLWPYRLGRKPDHMDSPPLKAIRQHCLECAGSSQEVASCTGRLLSGDICQLHKYRFGKNPKRQGMGGNTDNIKAFQFAATHGAGQPQERPFQPDLYQTMGQEIPGQNSA